jgi:phosphonate transport system substrate-binding protein
VPDVPLRSTGRAGRPAATFTFALAPTLGVEPRLQVERAQPLAAYLERSLGRPVRIVVEDSYAGSLAALQAGRLDAAMLGEVAALSAAEAGGVDPLVLPVGADGKVPSYTSAIFTRLDTGIRTLAEISGARLALVDEQSASGYRMPRVMLREAGLDPDHDVQVTLFGRHRLVVAAVLNGEADVGATHADALRPPSPDRAPDYARLRVLAHSRSIPRGPLVVRANLPSRLRRLLVDALLAVHQQDRLAAQVLNVAGSERFIIAARSATPTLKSIAELAGVSYATVSRAINGAGDVAPETARRVQAIVDELGYRPNGHALTLHGRKAPLVGLTLDSRHPPPLVDETRRELALAGVPLVLCPVDGPLGDSPYLELLMDGRLGALIVSAVQAEEPEVVRVARTGRIVVPLDGASAQTLINLLKHRA